MNLLPAPHNICIEVPLNTLLETERTKFINTTYIIDSEVTLVYSNRSDVIDYYKKNLKQKKISFKIYVHDPTKLLDGIYTKIENWAEIPVPKWSSSFYARFCSFKDQQKPDHIKVIDSFGKREPKLSESELAKKLIEEEWIYPINIPGSFMYGGKYINLVKKLALAYQKTMGIDPLTEEYKFSNLVPISELIRTNYYYSACPNFHYHMKCTSTVEELKNLGLKAHLEQYIDPQEILLHTPGPNYVMNYCSCQGLWLAHQNRCFKGDAKVKRFYDKSVPTYRDEKGKLKSLDRLEIFERFEQVFLGAKEGVLDYAQDLKTNLLSFFALCNIPIQLIYGANWFCEDQAGVGYTYDFEYQGQTKNLEVGNLSYNATIWTKPYNIKYNNKEAYSGCSGLGIQRLVYLFLLSNGFDSSDWPI